MKKIKRKQVSEGQINEFVLAIAKSLLGKKMRTVTKLMQHDPALKAAVERYADDTQKFRDHLERTYGYDSPEALADEMDSVFDDLETQRKKLKK